MGAEKFKFLSIMSAPTTCKRALLKKIIVGAPLVHHVSIEALVQLWVGVKLRACLSTMDLVQLWIFLCCEWKGMWRIGCMQSCNGLGTTLKTPWCRCLKC
mmetsp:Transcript_15446/g.25798  ORF Transcript_15446/g.25798 Transcript_15446/m.25798 type:complete len:100 (+) Transcript_15446:584-883(+)